jgi:hypothetical protein
MVCIFFSHPQIVERCWWAFYDGIKITHRLCVGRYAGAVLEPAFGVECCTAFCVEAWG